MQKTEMLHFLAQKNFPHFSFLTSHSHFAKLASRFLLPSSLNQPHPSMHKGIEAGEVVADNLRVAANGESKTI
jgi:hypothetical protein